MRRGLVFPFKETERLQPGFQMEKLHSQRKSKQKNEEIEMLVSLGTFFGPSGVLHILSSGTPFSISFFRFPIFSSIVCLCVVSGSPSSLILSEIRVRGENGDQQQTHTADFPFQWNDLFNSHTHLMPSTTTANARKGRELQSSHALESQGMGVELTIVDDDDDSLSSTRARLAVARLINFRSNCLLGLG